MRLCTLLLAHCFIGALLASAYECPVAAGDEPAAAASSSWARTRLEEGRIVLDVASREFLAPGGTGPRLWLVGAIHVADAPFYRRVQALLDAQEVVLYEQVLPHGAGRLRAEPPEAAVEDTWARLRFLAGLVADMEARTGEVPTDLPALATAAATQGIRLGHVARRTVLDAWGRAVLLLRGLPSDPEPGWRLVSLGADGATGGDGSATDLVVGSDEPVERLGVGRGFDLQRELAAVLRLAYQGDGIDYERRRWVLSDLSVDELERATKARGGDLDRVLDVLEGGGLRGALIRLLIGTAKLADGLTQGRASAYAKVMLALALAETDPEAFDAPGSDPVDAATMKAILFDRNARVLDDLAETLVEQPRLERVAVFYGAAHMPDLERSLRARGWSAGRELWLPAISVDLARAGLDPADIDDLRERVREQVGSR